LGYSREEIICKTAEELKLFPDSEVRDLLIADIINKKPVREIEIEAIKKDGSSIFGLFSADLIYIGKDLCLLTVMVDITERKTIEKALKESEARWNFAIEGSGDGLWDWNAQANEVFFSNQWKALLGYTENEIGTGFDEWKKRIHPDDMEKTMVYLNKHLKGITEVYLHEYRLRCKDGSYKWIFDRGKVFERTADGKPLRVIGTCTNISDRKRYEESLRESINKEKELNELKSRFVSMASHEFRTPLASILMSSDILIAYWKRLDELQITEKLNTIKGQVLHLTNVVTDVMQISKIQEGKSVFNPQPSDLIELCRNTILTFNSNNELINKIEFVSKYEKLNMKIDVRLIQQVMNNLISNAIKYSNENPIVKISLYEENEEILLSVADNGIGIPEDEQKNLFQPFYRASNATVIQGNGLGLNIVKESMKLHGGSIKFESLLGKGTTFVVHFPKVLIKK
jgi:PAS domain S-box-containing protein